MASPLEMAIEWVESNVALSAIAIGSLQACLIAVVSWMFCKLLPQRVSLQNFVWRAAVIAMLLLGPIHFMTGGWRLAVHLSSLPSEASQIPARVSDSTAQAIDSHVPSSRTSSGDDIVPHVERTTGEPDEQVISGAAQAVAILDGMPAASSVRRISLPSRAEKFDGWRILLIAYSAVVAWLSLRFVYHTARLSGIARNALPLATGSTALVRRQAQAIGLKSTPLVYRSALIKMPLVCWIGKQQVLVPIDFDEWPTRNRETVLLHEFAHIARGDLVWEFLSRFLCIIYWFHPATYFLSRQLKRSCELATDEYVIRRGQQATEYAQGLLAATLHLTNRFDEKVSGSVLAMVGYTTLEERLKNILSLTALSWRLKSFCYAMSFLVVLLGIASSVRIERAVAQTEPSRGSAEKNESTNSTRPIDSVVKWGDQIRDAKVSVMPPKTDNAILNIRGKTLNADGSIAPNAIVLLRRWTSNQETLDRTKGVSNEERWLVMLDDVLGRTVSDSEGAFHFEEIASPDVPSNYSSDWGWDVVALGDHGAVGWIHVLHDRKGSKIDRSIEVRLRPTTSIAGRFETPEGAPIAGALVKLTGLELSFSENYFPESDPDTIRLWYSQLSAVSKTDSDGRFRFEGVPIGPAAAVGITHSNWSPTGAAIATDPNSKLGDRRKLPPGVVVSTNILVASPATIVADPGFMMHGRVFSADGTPIQGAMVGRGSTLNPKATDREGQFTIRLSKNDFERASRPTSSNKTPFDIVGVNTTLLANPNMAASNNKIPFDIVGPEGSSYLAKRQFVSIEKLQAREKVEFKLDRGVRVSGRVVTDTGEPIPSVRMQLAGPREEKAIEATTDTNGRYSFVAPKKDVLMFATIESPGYQLPSRRSVDSTSPDELAKGPHMKLALAIHDDFKSEDFIVKRIGLVRIRVLVSEGIPAKGADVILKFERPYPDFGQGRPMPSPKVETISNSHKTDENGEVSIQPKEGVIKTAYAEVSFHDGSKSYLVKTPIGEATDGLVEVRLDRTWHVKGRILRNGIPYPGVALSISSVHHPTTTDPIFRNMFTSRTIQSATSDSEGRYEFIVPPEGEYRVGLERKPEDGRGDSISKSIKHVADGEYEVSDIQLLDVDGEISGKVVDSSGAPVSGARVSLMSAMGVSPASWIGHYKESAFTTDAEGRFSLKKIPEGTFQLTASGPRKPGERTSSVRTEAKTGDRDVQIVVDAAPLPTPPRLTPKSISEPSTPSKK